MRCHEARQRVGPYLDSELDVANALEIQRHLELCPDCARFFEGESRLESHLKKQLGSGRKDPSLWNDVEKRVGMEAAPPPVFSGTRLLRSKAVKWLAAAAAVMALVALMVWPGMSTLDLAAISAIHHQEYLDREIAAQFRGPMPREFALKLTGEIDPDAFKYAPVGFDYENQGARLCYLKGVPAAMIFGRSRGTTVSMLVFKRSDLGRFPMAEKKLASGFSIVCARAGKYQFAARIIGGHVVCAIGDTSKSELEEMIRTVKEEA